MLTHCENLNISDGHRTRSMTSHPLVIITVQGTIHLTLTFLLLSGVFKRGGEITKQIGKIFPKPLKMVSPLKSKKSILV